MMTNKDVLRMLEGYNGERNALHRPSKATTAAPSRKGHLSQKARDVLELLNVAPSGLAEPLLLTYGFTLKLLAGLVHAGLATTLCRTVRFRGQPVKIVRVRITAAGCQALRANKR